MGQVDGKVVVITGAGGGIGRAEALLFASEGARVVVNDLGGSRDGAGGSSSMADAVVAEIKAAGGEAVASYASVSSVEGAQSIVDTAVKTWGKLDVLVNNAGILRDKTLLKMDEAMWDAVVAVHLKGTFLCMQAAARQMIAQGHGGKIINMASQAGRRGEALVSAYCATKAAVISLTQSAGLDLIQHRINVNAIAPGVVDTPMWDQVDALFARYEHRAPGEKKRLVGQAVPFGRMGRPDDHVGAATFLASADADFVVAQTLNVDGGNWMS
jgi:NAD(P)-dependent dehydrogenase (short-subunit alcohol dehydrogenase family)